MTKNYNYTRVCCYIGYFVQAIINNFLPLLFVTFNTGYGISLERLGTLIVINFCTQIAVDIISVKIIDTVGYKNTALLAHVLAATGLTLLAILPRVMDNTYLAIIISVLFYAFGSGLIEVIISPIIEYLPSSGKAASMSLLHSFYCWGQLVTVLLTTVLFLAIGIKNWSYISLIWATVPFINLFLFIKAPIVVPESEREHKRNKDIFKEADFYIMLLVMLCAGASELAVSQWASAFAETALHLDKAAGDLLGPCAFALFMGTGRVIYGVIGEKINIKLAMLFCAVLCFVSYIVIALSPSAMVSLIFCAICGFSVSVMWPGTLSMSAARFVTGGALMFGLLAAFGDLGCSAGPWVTGIIADKFGLNKGFLLSAIFPLFMIFVIIYLIKKDSIAKTR
ncbi:MAG: MFS transporter [Ruminococcaceae bacterium]|nr:MFS transporter [Oscillospiraceae bacterium]